MLKLTVNADGGTPATGNIYSYSIDGTNFQNQNFFSNLPVPANPTYGTDAFGGIWMGDYTVTAKDADGCLATTTVTIQSPVKFELLNCPNEFYVR